MAVYDTTRSLFLETKHMIQANDDKPRVDEKAASKLRLVLDMQQFGIRMMRQNLIRRHPDESPEQIDARLSGWLAKSPDADDPRFEVRPCRSGSKNS